MQKAPSDSQSDRRDQYSPSSVHFPPLPVSVFYDTLLSHHAGTMLIAGRAPNCRLSTSAPLSIPYSSHECLLFLMHPITPKAFLHNKFRVETDTVLNCRFKKSHASWMEGAEKGLCLLLPCLCLSSNGYWFCL